MSVQGPVWKKEVSKKQLDGNLKLIKNKANQSVIKRSVPYKNSTNVNKSLQTSKKNSFNRTSPKEFFIFLKNFILTDA
jgi:Tfp pilus assembly protein PilV